MFHLADLRLAESGRIKPREDGIAVRDYPFPYHAALAVNNDLDFMTLGSIRGLARLCQWQGRDTVRRRAWAGSSRQLLGMGAAGLPRAAPAISQRPPARGLAGSRPHRRIGAARLVRHDPFADGVRFAAHGERYADCIAVDAAQCECNGSCMGNRHAEQRLDGRPRPRRHLLWVGSHPAARAEADSLMSNTAMPSPILPGPWPWFQRGDDPTNDAYCLDLLKQFGVRFFWLGPAREMDKFGDHLDYKGEPQLREALAQYDWADWMHSRVRTKDGEFIPVPLALPEGEEAKRTLLTGFFNRTISIVTAQDQGQIQNFQTLSRHGPAIRNEFCNSGLVGSPQRIRGEAWGGNHLPAFRQLVVDRARS